MRHIELHILQSFPVSCLNRDDLNSPKTAVFGGVQRARVSSQCWKRAVRELLISENDSESNAIFKGKRGRWLIEKFETLLKKKGINEANALAICIGHYLAKIDSKNSNRVKTSLFLSQMELEAISQGVVTLGKEKLSKLIDAGKVNLTEIEREGDSDLQDEIELTEKKKPKASKGDKISSKEFTKLVERTLKPVFSNLYKKDDIRKLPKDAADIAIFGRMVANDSSLNIEGAAAFNHALSVHKVENEIDYFSAVDEMQPSTETGAAITGTLEFNSATYYRFAALNLDLLFDKDHLACLENNERKEVVKTFVKATLQSVPVARRNSMNGNVPPNYVLCVLREKGHPIQLINAFEKPIQSKNGFVKESIVALENEYKSLKETWDLEGSELRMPEKNLSALLMEVEKHVN